MDVLTRELQPESAEACNNLKDEIIASIDDLEKSVKSTLRKTLWIAAAIQFTVTVAAICYLLYHFEF